ncbi:response regulator transcription factor [Amycolatopsis sp. cmx-11-12]|uniref:response regulator transcription factor n=1 Tax=Amycolatopsis sp. cmx-11-12 TaxID=2785795 RepID=UPI0039180430
MVRSATLFGISATMWTAIGTDPRNYGRFSAHGAEITARVIDALGLDTFKRHHRLGRAFSHREATRYVLGQKITTPRASTGPDNPLTPREYEVAELVARGLMNRQIAGQLGIAPRTAGTHIGHILTKLGFASRARLATWVTSRRA